MSDKHSDYCKVCQYGVDEIDWSLNNRVIGEIVDCSEASVRRHKKWSGVNGVGAGADLKVTREDGEWIPRRKWDKADGSTGYSYEYAEPESEDPPWPVIDRPVPLFRTGTATPHEDREWKVAVVGADTQIGYRRFEDGTTEAFHDEEALSLFNTLVELENPDAVVIAGDIIDMPEQGKFSQEATFANTTQMSLDRTYEWLVDLRSKTTGAIHLIEGNHDKRLQNFVELNAKAAFGLRQAGWPESWPVMSLPYLLRLNELDVDYYDSYPNAHVWLNNHLRAEHGTKANSRGSTAQRYLDETPHVSRIIGHSHRQEVVQRTTWDRMGKIRSQVVNPGCLCRVDGAVPSVNGSIGANGKSSTMYEDWQQGAALIHYNDDEFFVTLVQFDDGRMVYQGVEYRA